MSVSKLSTNLFLFILTAWYVSAAPVQTVVLISVDGLGQHLLDQVDTPEITRLAHDGQKARRAETTLPPTTLPAHTTMLTGVDPARHGILQDQHDAALARVHVPTLFRLLHDHGLHSRAVVGKEKLQYIFDSPALDSLRCPTRPLVGDLYARLPWVTDRIAIQELGHRPAFLFVHYAAVDTMGHWFQWESWPQKLALRSVDASIGRLRKAVEELWPAGSFAIILTADHGGHRGSHGQTNSDGTLEEPEYDRVIPWIVYGASLKDRTQTVQMADTAPSIAHLLGVTPPADWAWQGTNVLAP